MPGKMVVYPVRREFETTKSDSTSNANDFASKPNSSVQPMPIAKKDTTGIVSTILAIAEPMAKFKLD